MRLKRQVLKCALFVFITAAVVVVLGCGGSAHPALEAVLQGLVVHDGTHEALAGIPIIVENQKTQTAMDGTWSLQVDNRGGTTVNVLAEGYMPAQIEVDEATGQIDVGTIYLKPQIVAGHGTVTGIVADAGRPVENAQVSVGAIASVTDASGEYTLYNVPQGRQEVVATTGQKFGTADVIVISRRTVTADIAISANPPIVPF